MVASLSSSKRRRRRSIGGSVDCSSYDASTISTQTSALEDVSVIILLLSFQPFLWSTRLLSLWPPLFSKNNRFYLTKIVNPTSGLIPFNKRITCLYRFFYMQHLNQYETGSYNFAVSGDASRDLYIQQLADFTGCGHTILTSSNIKRSYDALSEIIGDLSPRTATQVSEDTGMLLLCGNDI